MARSQNRDMYEALHRSFRWAVPADFNIAEVCCRRWARADDADRRTAVLADGPGLQPRAHSYAELQQQANRLSHALAGLGVKRGDRVAIVLPQRFETAVAYMAVLQMGAVAMPLSTLFGPEALEFRLNDSATAVLICDDASIVAVQNIRGSCEALRHVIGVGDSRRGDAGGGAAQMADLDYAAITAGQPPEYAPVATRADEAAVLIYTSGTTGNPKGALIPHRALIGNLTGFICSQNWFGFDPQATGPLPALPQPRTPSVFWSPADWSWTGGLMDALLPSLYFGRPIVAWNGRFSAQTAFELLQKHEVTHTFLFPTALKAMMKAFPEPGRFFRLRLQAIMSAGEAVGDAVFAYCREQLGVTVNEMFGQTEVNYIVGNCSIFWPARPGSMGKGYPGHRVAVIDEQGRECAAGELGEVAIHRRDVHGEPDPIFFLGYWKNETGTRAKYTGDWCRTGDLALRDADGYLWYQGRADDMFKAAGYRIGPGEIENCLLKHPAVANAAVVPKPDAERGALVKAYVVLTPEAHAAQGDGAVLVAELQLHVRGKLAPYEYPKEIEFIEALPMTTTGKVQRRVLRLQEEERARRAGLADRP
ncbi:MAG: AMP-binding protein [Curvibacter sp.]